jgi:uncharacterized protein YndB with AHSA1/START domain
MESASDAALVLREMCVSLLWVAVLVLVTAFRTGWLAVGVAGAIALPAVLLLSLRNRAAAIALLIAVAVVAIGLLALGAIRGILVLLFWVAVLQIAGRASRAAFKLHEFSVALRGDLPGANTKERDMTNTILAPVAKAQMLIHKPAAQVFEALMDPASTSRFWYSKSSGRLEAGKRVRWDWEMYGVFTEVEVKEIEKNRRILIEWNGPDNPTSVEWRFEAREEDRTFVTVKNWGFAGNAEKIVAEAMDSTGGFSFLLADLKAYLEHGVELNLVEDHDPAALVEGWTSRRRK